MHFQNKKKKVLTLASGDSLTFHLMLLHFCLSTTLVYGEMFVIPIRLSKHWHATTKMLNMSNITPV